MTAERRRALVFGVLWTGVLSVTVSTAATQTPHNTDLLVCNVGLGGPAGLTGRLLRVSPSGSITTIVASQRFGGRYPNGIVMDAGNTNAALLELQPGGTNLVRVWDVSRGIASTTLAALRVTPNWIDHGNAGALVLFAGRRILEVAPGGGVTTVAVLPSVALSGVHDLLSGGYITGDANAAVHRVAPNGTITRTDRFAPTLPYGMDQDHRTGSVFIGSGTSVYEIDSVGTWSTVRDSNIFSPGVMTFDRGAGNGELVLGSNPVYRMDTNGVVFTTHVGFPGIANTGMCFDKGRNLVVTKVGTPNRYRLDVHNPAGGAGGEQYVIAFSTSGFAPGFRIPGVGVVQLRFDGATNLSIQGRLPFLANNIGTLDAFGRASATLDLGNLPVPLTGIAVWAVAVTWRGSTITMISKPVVTTLA